MPGLRSGIGLVASRGHGRSAAAGGMATSDMIEIIPLASIPDDSPRKGRPNNLIHPDVPDVGILMNAVLTCRPSALQQPLQLD